MWKNYFKIAYRNLLKKKVYSLINVLGLGIGMACCVLIFLFVQDELSYDNYHEKGDRIYRLIHGSRSPEGLTEGAEEAPFWVWHNAPVGPALKEEFPEIDKIVQFSGRSDLLLSYGETTLQEDGVFFMDSTVFDVFSWKLLRGNARTALVAPFSIVLTESTAKKYFGDEDPLGKTLKGSESAGRADAGDYTVTGVMADVPSNSHFTFNALLSLSTFKQSRPDVFDAWGYVDFYTYFLVNEGFDPVAFEAKLPDFIQRRRGGGDDKYAIKVEALKDVYLRTTAQRLPGETGSLTNIYVFSMIGVFILAIAMINFMNLSTARSMERAKEVGIRKSIGADRESLIYQFLGESLIIVILAAMVAVVFVSVALPLMNDLTGKEFLINQVINWQTIPFFVGIILIVGLLAGSYPAFVLSSFQPVSILKGLSKANPKGALLRKGLVIFQFSLSIALIAGTMIVYTQMGHLLDKDMGFDKEQMLVLDYNYDEQVNFMSSALKSELEALPSVNSAAFSRSVPGSYFPNAYTTIENADGEMFGQAQPVFQVGIDFVNHYGLELVAGRSYSRDYPSDSSSALVLNEAAARQYGYANPADIVGKKFDQWGRAGTVIGVVKDFNYISLHRTIEPLTLPFEAYASRYLSLKVSSEDLPATIAQVEQIWEKLAPHRPFLYSFLDEDFNNQYQSDFRFRRIFTTFSVLAILIACLGLLGLATYTAEQRTKEIGVRKVLGANVSSIVGLLSKDFVKLVLVAIVIATPVSWYAMNKWLEGFAYKVPVHWWTFAIAGILAVVVALVTISFQSIKAALMNPVKSLRSE
ncbi:ABC transporter permease [Algoriphagus aestuariicola]|uniref:ABC transporter permease n=1 Tax=Algoriphagus aestuariicola TaxID=1852016 RepID=A0ABS3BM10_9BACT|nr:ABC transporter permease [Algoriphagus aestuariicola]MBN7800337.1 ABC transporter permease [Algoriphagus aestuariicola]